MSDHLSFSIRDRQIIARLFTMDHYRGAALPVHAISVVVPRVPVTEDKQDLRPRGLRMTHSDGHRPTVLAATGPSAQVQSVQDSWQLYQRMAEGISYLVLRDSPRYRDDQ
jgi:hypothetical protein